MRELGQEPVGMSISMDMLVVITRVEEAGLGLVSLLVGGDRSLARDRLGDLDDWDGWVGVGRYPRCCVWWLVVFGSF